MPSAERRMRCDLGIANAEIGVETIRRDFRRFGRLYMREEVDR
jgi:hypothetical protein